MHDAIPIGGLRRRLSITALLCLWSLAGCATLSVGGRHYLLHVPAGADKGSPKPLIIVLHGGGSRAKAMPRFTGMNAVADKDGFLVAYPQGKDRHWNDGRPNAVKADDVGFMNNLIDRVSKNYNVDPNRIYAAGISNGAMFANRLGCDLGGRIAAIAAVAGTLPRAIADGCKPARPVSILQISGTDDPIVPYAGGKVASFAGFGQGGLVLGARQNFERWRQLDRCTQTLPAQRLSAQDDGDPTRVVRIAAGDCAGQAAVVLYRVEGGGHAWPGGPQYLPEAIIGRASDQLDATQTIVRFFLSHGRH